QILPGFTGMMTLGEAEGVEFFTMLIEHPRVTIGRNQRLAVIRSDQKPRLRLASATNGGLELSLDVPAKESQIAIDGSLWQWQTDKRTLSLLIDKLPPHYRALLAGETICVSPSDALTFQSGELPNLQSWFAVERVGKDGSSFEAISIEPAIPRLALEFE